MDQQIVEYYQAMSNFELADLGLSYSSSLQDQISVFMSALFAYLAVAYFVGKTLTKFQLVSISVIYSAFILNTIVSYFSISVAAGQLTTFLTGTDFGIKFGITTLVLVGAWVLSLAFMVQSRTRNDT